MSFDQEEFEDIIQGFNPGEELDYGEHNINGEENLNFHNMNNSEERNIVNIINRLDNPNGNIRFINPVDLRHGWNGIASMITTMINSMRQIKEDEQQLCDMINFRMKIIKSAVENNINIIEFPDGSTIVVSEQERSRILARREDPYERYDRLGNSQNEILYDGEDLYNYLWKELCELWIITVGCKEYIERWAENRLEKWTGSRKDMLEQIHTMLQGVKL